MKLGKSLRSIDLETLSLVWVRHDVMSKGSIDQRVDKLVSGEAINTATTEIQKMKETLNSEAGAMRGIPSKVTPPSKQRKILNLLNPKHGPSDRDPSLSLRCITVYGHTVYVYPESRIPTAPINRFCRRK